MEDKRYSESSAGDSVPVLSFGAPSSTSVNYSERLRQERRTNYYVPDVASRSGTSSAADCFVKRAFSDKLQQFMLSYSYTLVTSTVLSGEI